MPRTGAQLERSLSLFLNDSFASTTTSTGSTDGQTLFDTILQRFGSGQNVGGFIRITQDASPNNRVVRRIRAFTEATGAIEVMPGFPVQVESGDSYELHRFDPATKFDALDQARKRVFPDLFRIVVDEFITGDGLIREFDIPTSMPKGPAFAFIESPLGVEAQWNFLQSPRGDSLQGWITSNGIATIISRDDSDLVIPKYDSNATQIKSVSETIDHSQPVGNMINGITAVRAAGRLMTFGAWVHYRGTEPMTIQITDDTGNSFSSQHQGNGWELLTVERRIAIDNTTTLIASFLFISASVDEIIFWNRAWFYFGETARITDIYTRQDGLRIRRDDTTQRAIFDEIPPRGLQLQLIGQDFLTSLGTSPSSQVALSMEVSETSQDLLIAKAARHLYESQGLITDNPQEVLARILQVEARTADYKMRMPFRLPATPQIKGPWNDVRGRQGHLFPGRQFRVTSARN